MKILLAALAVSIAAIHSSDVSTSSEDLAQLSASDLRALQNGTTLTDIRALQICSEQICFLNAFKDELHANREKLITVAEQHASIRHRYETECILLESPPRSRESCSTPEIRHEELIQSNIELMRDKDRRRVEQDDLAWQLLVKRRKSLFSDQQ